MPSSGMWRCVGLLPIANVPTSPILYKMTMEAIGFSDTSVLTRATRRQVQEGSILHSHSRETLKSYIALTG
jgi:hypothetical protein